ncbi:MAG TPA: response regulator transcription factor [Gemmata sp.]
MNKLRVYLVDDHPVVRNGLRVLLGEQDDMEIVGEAPDGSTAVREVLELRPNVVVMDVSMPGMGGAEATRQIRAGGPEVRVVGLTAHEDRAYLQQVIGAGASGYVLKRTAAVELLGAIRHAAAGNTYLDPAIAGHLVSSAGAPLAQHGGQELSEREEEVLKGIARGYSNKQIAARLKVSIKTVETYKARGMEKLGARSRVDLVRQASVRGWLAES